MTVVAKRLVGVVECYEIMVFEKLVSNFMLQKYEKKLRFPNFLCYLYTRKARGPSVRDRALPLHDGFQLARGGGKVLDVELVVLRARAGPVTSSNRLRHPCGNAPSRLLARN